MLDQPTGEANELLGIKIYQPGSTFFSGIEIKESMANELKTLCMGKVGGGLYITRLKAHHRARKTHP